MVWLVDWLIGWLRWSDEIKNQLTLTRCGSWAFLFRTGREEESVSCWSGARLTRRHRRFGVAAAGSWGALLCFDLWQRRIDGHGRKTRRRHWHEVGQRGTVVQYGIAVRLSVIVEVHCGLGGGVLRLVQSSQRRLTQKCRMRQTVGWHVHVVVGRCCGRRRRRVWHGRQQLGRVLQCSAFYAHQII